MTWKPALPRLAALICGIATLAPSLAAQPVDAFLPETTPAALDPAAPEASIGALVFRGGVEIAPDKAAIGGISGLEWHDGTLMAVSDDGRWMEITTDETGDRLTDIASVTIGPLRDEKGKALAAKTRGDAEAVTRMPSGEWLVAFEQDHRIWRYADLGGAATGTDNRAEALTRAAAPNEGIETLAAYDGGLIACGEWTGPARPNCLRIADDGAARPFTLPAPEGIAEAGGVPTDAACKADGTCYVLFRSFTPAQGNRAAVVALAPDNTATTLAVFAPPLLLDNFEGLALREVGGRTFLYIASDDNFRNCASGAKPGCQRTLLYKFEIAPAPGATDPARPGVRPDATAPSVTVVLDTSEGPITIALETARAPVTAGNFLRYVEEGRLAGTTFYRAMTLDGPREPSGIVQGGTRNDRARVLPPIAHEPTSTTGLTHTHGALSMAMRAPGSADGDFFIMVEDQTGFDADPSAANPDWQAGFAAFGYVTQGMEIVAAMLGAERDPQAGEGVMKGQMLARPVTILSARRVDVP